MLSKQDQSTGDSTRDVDPSLTGSERRTGPQPLFSPPPTLVGERNKDSVLFKLDVLAKGADQPSQGRERQDSKQMLAVSVPQGESGLINLNELAAINKEMRRDPSLQTSSSLLVPAARPLDADSRSQVSTAVPAAPVVDGPRGIRVLLMLAAAAAILVAVGAVVVSMV